MGYQEQVHWTGNQVRGGGVSGLVNIINRAKWKGGSVDM